MSRELHLKRLGFVWTYSEYYFNWVSASHPPPSSYPCSAIHGMAEMLRTTLLLLSARYGDHLLQGEILVQRSGIMSGRTASLLAYCGSSVTMLTLSAAAQTFGLVSSVYATGRALMPAPLAGVAGSLEHRVTELSLPVISIVQDHSERVRHHALNADFRVRLRIRG